MTTSATTITAYTIKNTAYGDRVADLYGAQQNRPIIGYHLHNGVNQKWIFHSQGGNKYKISTKSNGNATVYADTVYPAEDDDIFGTSTDTVYTVDPALGPTDANHKISVKTSSGATLYWTLDNVAERTKVTLEPDNGNSTQVWAIKRTV